MDEEKGHEIAYVQYPQNSDNLTNNDLYASTLRVINERQFDYLSQFLCQSWRWLAWMLMEGLAILVVGVFTEGKLFVARSIARDVEKIGEDNMA
ncbi:hypothetical protein RJ640_010201 [Escallonia rubra]|uniref:Uncharacterized protein n=1 Tax=Escallonia rubra TaxID=112253 RepID=A0AA88UQR1_9ASTE|nr:hypothetical protein RJ640_010201 [Escallonia rubra]